MSCSKVIIDTNVLISAIRNKESFSRKIINIVNKGYILAFVTKRILDEYKIILKKAINTEDSLITRYLSTIQEVVEKYHLTIVDIDPEDDKYINAALSIKADYIITADKHLLFYDKYENINIVTPKQFYESFSGEYFFD